MSDDISWSPIVPLPGTNDGRSLPATRTAEPKCILMTFRSVLTSVKKWSECLWKQEILPSGR